MVTIVSALERFYCTFTIVGDTGHQLHMNTRGSSFVSLKGLHTSCYKVGRDII